MSLGYNCEDQMVSWMERTKSCTQPAVSSIWNWDMTSTCYYWTWGARAFWAFHLLLSVPSSFCLVPQTWLSSIGVVGVERSAGSRCSLNGAGPSSGADHWGLTGYISPNFKASIKLQTHRGDPKLAPHGVNYLILHREYFQFSKNEII